MPRGVHVNDDIIKELIAVVTETKFVYDVGDKRHSDACQMRGFWDEVAQSFNIVGMDGNGWRSRWKNLRDTYMKHRKRINGKKGFLGVNKMVKWKFFDQMNFLEPYMPKTTSLKDEPLSEESHESDGDKPDVMDGNGSSTSNGSEFHDEISTDRSTSHTSHRSKPYHHTKPARKRPSYKDNRISQTVSDYISPVTRLRQEHQEDQDPDRLLFQSYALRMKMLSRDAQALIKMQMSQIFYNIENPHLPPVPYLSLGSFDQRQHNNGEWLPQATTTVTQGETPDNVPGKRQTFLDS